MKVARILSFAAAVIASVVFAGEAPKLSGIYRPESAGSRMQLSSTGELSLESTGKVKIWFFSGRWKIVDSTLILSRDKEVARYSILNGGMRLVLIARGAAAPSVEYNDVALAKAYQKEPNPSPEPTAPSGRGSS